MKKSRKYRGVLSDPVRIKKADVRGISIYDGLFELEEEILHKRRIEKLDDLFQHFHIDTRDEQAWERLAFALACEHVPGFQLADRSGRKKNRVKQGALTDLEVYQRINKLLEEKLRRTGHRQTVRAAADWLRADLKRESKKNGRPVGFYTATTLAKMHSKGKNEHLDRLKVQNIFRSHPFFGGLIPLGIGVYPGGRKLKP